MRPQPIPPWELPIPWASSAVRGGEHAIVPRTFLRPLYALVGDVPTPMGVSVTHPYNALLETDYAMYFWSRMEQILSGIDISARSLYRTKKSTQDHRLTGTVIPYRDSVDPWKYREAIRRINNGH